MHNWKNKVIQISYMTQKGAKFSPFTPKSYHRIITAPHGDFNGNLGVYVEGENGEPVKILFCEFRTIVLPKIKRTKYDTNNRA